MTKKATHGKNGPLDWQSMSTTSTENGHWSSTLVPNAVESGTNEGFSAGSNGYSKAQVFNTE